ncbi:MAG: hypothetical protein ACOC35_05600, partial [Promethearchaeia archaeon]
EIIGIISKNLIELINSNKITRAISEAYTTLKNYTKLDKEENLLSFFRDKIKHTILKILQKGVISKVQLDRILRKQYGFSTSNIDLILSTFIREGLVKNKNVAGYNDYFLVKDLSCIRIPPQTFTISADDGELYETYTNEFQAFYKNFDCASEIENKRILNFLMDTAVFSLIKRLRNEVLTVNECHNILNNRQEILDDLININYVFEAQGKIILLSDIRFIKFTPAYIIQNIAKRYAKEEISFDQFSEHINLFKEQITAQKDEEIVNFEII